MLAELPVKVLPLTVAVPEPLTVTPEIDVRRCGGRRRSLAELPVKVLSRHRRRPGVVEAAAGVGGVAGEGAVAHRHRPDRSVSAAAAGCRRPR